MAPFLAEARLAGFFLRPEEQAAPPLETHFFLQSEILFLRRVLAALAARAFLADEVSLVPLAGILTTSDL